MNQLRIFVYESASARWHSSMMMRPKYRGAHRISRLSWRVWTEQTTASGMPKVAACDLASWLAHLDGGVDAEVPEGLERLVDEDLTMGEEEGPAAATRSGRLEHIPARTVLPVPVGITIRADRRRVELREQLVPGFELIRAIIIGADRSSWAHLLGSGMGFLAPVVIRMS